MADKVRLLCSDEVTIEVDVAVISLSKLIKGLIDDQGAEEIIPLVGVKSGILNKIIEMCVYLQTKPEPEIIKPLIDTDMAKVVDDPWYVNYINVEHDVLFELIMASNYLDVTPIIELACAKLGTQMKGKSVKEFRKHFNIVNDFTPEEEAAIEHEG